MVSFDMIKAARERIKALAAITPLRESKYFSELLDASVFLKLENEQVTGSFKVRGAINRLITLPSHEIEKGIITASTGNHGLGVAYAARQLGISAIVVFPINGSREKLDRLKEAGAEVIQTVGYEEIEQYARQLAKEKGLIYVSPYNDSEIVAGAGTIGIEIMEQLDNIDAILVPIGGGGLISGIALAAKAKNPDVLIVGVQSEASPEVYESWKAGHWVQADEFESLAQGLMGGVESDSITLDLIGCYVDKIVLVPEKSILQAMLVLYEKENLKIEGAGAVPVAAILTYLSDFKGKRIVLVLSGGNISDFEINSLQSKTEANKS